MLEKLKELQKEEAIERLKILNKKYELMETVIEEFTKEDIVYYSEYMNSAFPAVLYWVSNRQDLTELIEEIERKEQILVYHAMLTPTAEGAYFSMLYVSKYPDEWQRDREELQEGLPVAYCVNLADPEMAEFGGIQIAGSMGGITRLA